MAVIAQTSKKQNGAFTVTETTLTASDTLTYISGSGQLLVLRNTTGAPVNVTIDGSGSTTITPPGYGGTVDVSTGKLIAVGANAVVAVYLDKISAFMLGTVAVTGGVGVVASLIG